MMAPGVRLPRSLVPSVALPLSVVLFSASGAAFITQFSPLVGFAVTALFAVVVLSFISVDFGLYVLIISMLLGPEILVGNLGAGSTAGRGITLRPEDFLLSTICVVWLARGAVVKDLGLLRATPLNRPIFAYTVIVILCTLWGIITGRVRPLVGAFFALKYIQYFVLYFMVVNYCRDRAHAYNLLLALLITCALACLYGFTQIPSGERVSAPFEGESGEPNTFGGYLVLMCAVITSFLLSLPQPKVRLLLCALGGMVLINLAATLSRSSYLAMIAFLGMLITLSEKRIPIVIALLFSAMLFLVVAPRSVVERITFTWSQQETSGQIHVGRLRLDTSTSDRLQSWKEVWTQDWFNHPLLGYGVTGYRFLDAQYPRVVAETGLAGFVVFLWLLGSIFHLGLERYRTTRDPFLRAVSLGFLTGYVGLLAHAIGANTFIIVRIMEPFWLLAGIVTMIPALETAPAQPEPEASLSVRYRNSAR
ncbi:MAG: O-antigen ligase family protein [Deltaproteobacteria bacterium]|nr:O-antigen ligase family protein [Deltaproteobacteria bacterium]